MRMVVCGPRKGNYVPTLSCDIMPLIVSYHNAYKNAQIRGTLD